MIDAAGRIVAPGLIDMHVHLREPGFEADETIHSGTAAALAGGFTSVACIPNTNPPIDSPGAIALVRDRAARADHCHVFVDRLRQPQPRGQGTGRDRPAGRGRARWPSATTAPVADAGLMRRALEYCRMFDKPILNHAEVPELAENGVMHEGLVSLELGLPGIPAAAEEVMVLRDIALAEATGGRLHVMHVSTAKSVEAVRQAKGRGVRVTAEAAPHHFSLTDEKLRGFDPNFKMNPPLRTRQDTAAIIAGLADGTIDAVASDHAPHAAEKKLREIDQAPFGIVGLETSLGLVVTNLIEPGHIDWPTAIRLMSLGPARILGLNKGTLAIGADADITIIDPEARWTVDPREFRSKSRNTAFAGMELIGRAAATIVGGRVKFQRE